MSYGAPSIPTGVAVRRRAHNPYPATVEVPRPSALKSDAPNLLEKWGSGDERKLQEAQAFIEQAQARRNMALQAVDAALSRAGIGPDTMELVRGAFIENATDIRAALAPFDPKGA